MYMSSYRIRQLIYEIKNRYRIRALRQGASLFILSFLFFAVIFFILEYKFDFSPFIRGIGIVLASSFLIYVSGIFWRMTIAKPANVGFLFGFIADNRLYFISQHYALG